MYFILFITSLIFSSTGNTTAILKQVGGREWSLVPKNKVHT